MKRFGGKRAVAIAVAGFAAIAGGVAWGAIPDGNGVIHACVARDDGDVRLVDASAKCRHDETAVTWNQTGPQGIAGSPPEPAVEPALGAVVDPDRP